MVNNRGYSVTLPLASVKKKKEKILSVKKTCKTKETFTNNYISLYTLQVIFVPSKNIFDLYLWTANALLFAVCLELFLSCVCSIFKDSICMYLAILASFLNNEAGKHRNANHMDRLDIIHFDI